MPTLGRKWNQYSFDTMSLISKVVMILQAKTKKPYGMFFIKMLNELILYVLVVYSAHQKSSVKSDIQGRIDRT